VFSYTTYQIWPFYSSGDRSRRDDEREQNKQGSPGENARQESTGFEGFFKRRILRPNTSADATCDELFVEETIHAMKKAIIFGSAISVIGLMLVSCSSTPETTTTTTRQTTVTAPPPVPASRTTTTTTHMGGGY
jgi:hypothetical protein